MDFYELLARVIEVLQREGRTSYRALKRQFGLDDAYLEDVKVELIEVKQLAVDQDGTMLVWIGDARTTPATAPPAPPTAPRPATPEASPPQTATPPAAPPVSDAERRQLTVLFCDLVDSTVLARQLDPEDLREVVRAYQDTCARVIARYDGHIAQYLGDGLLVYFGYPRAHEDDAQRAVRAGLGIVEALGQLNTHLAQEGLCPAPTQSRQRGVSLAVRLGIHTGLVVVGEVGGGTRQEQLALGETPNLAARLQGIAAPNTLVISAATSQLLGGFFACQSLGTPPLKGLAQPMEVYQVLYESMARSRLEAAGSTGLTPLVGREQEVGLLLERWAQVKDGLGQVVLLSGEAGIGKSRLVQVLKEHVAAEPQAWLTPCQCSPYYQNTALYPMIDLLERVALRFEREESPPQKLSKLEGFVVQYGLPLAETVPLFAALLSLPLSADYAPLTGSPAQQKQQTMQALLTILLRRAAQQPVLFVMEDLHWVDPTTLEFLSLVVDQGPTARILALFTLRPDFSPPWTGRAHLTQVTLNRLPRRQAAEMTDRVAHGKALPGEVVEQVVAKTDGVPLFVEELTKMVLESGLLQEREERYELTGPLPPLAIPATLHDSLMARLDRLAAVKGLAQLGATLGREFSYELLQAVSPWDEGPLQQGLHQLVEAEFLYQQGLPPQATYLFKHALIQEAAYQSLLRSTRQRYHQHIAQVVEARFPELCETQPELLAQHYTEAGLSAQALPYWQRAGARALQRSSNLEAISHLTRGLEVLTTLPESRERAHQELALQLTLGPAVMNAGMWGSGRTETGPLQSTPGSAVMHLRGQAVPEVECVYVRACELARQVGDTQQLFSALWGLYYLHQVRGQLQRVHEVGEELLDLAQQLQDPMLFLEAHRVLGNTLFWRGELGLAHAHAQHALALYDPQQMRDHTVRYGQDSGVSCRSFGAMALWLLGYPDQARQWIEEALTYAQRLRHAYTLAQALIWSATLHHLQGEAAVAQERAEASRALCTEHGFASYLAWSMILRGSALVAQGAWAEGLAQMREGLAAYGAMARLPWLLFLGLLAEACGRVGQVEEGLRALDEALEAMQTTEERIYEAEVYRLRGVLLLQQSAEQQREAEASLQQALDVARRQQAKSLELRAAISLSRLWQRQGRHAEAHALLAPIYGWFTEGFDTADLQEAKALLEALGT
jgi:class 3 adenylate cyclase/predicted ATPase